MSKTIKEMQPKVTKSAITLPEKVLLERFVRPVCWSEMLEVIRYPDLRSFLNK
ncbi:MAG: hypothetical protein VKL42_18340 [Snowella sp.]|nr:hypothetical protein [Snowella sp.]